MDLNLIREARETINWLLTFPDKLLSAIMQPYETFLRRRERIKKLKEMVEIREIIKQVQQIYLIKGDLSQQIDELRSVKTPENAEIVRGLMQAVAFGASEIRATLAEVSLSNTPVSTEASLVLAKIETVYRKFARLPDDVLLNDEIITEIANTVQLIVFHASDVLKQLDDHRKLLDYTYGDDH